MYYVKYIFVVIVTILLNLLWFIDLDNYLKMVILNVIILFSHVIFTNKKLVTDINKVKDENNTFFDAFNSMSCGVIIVKNSTIVYINDSVIDIFTDDIKIIQNKHFKYLKTLLFNYTEDYDDFFSDILNHTYINYKFKTYKITKNKIKDGFILFLVDKTTNRKNDHILKKTQKIGKIGTWEKDFKTDKKTYWSDSLYEIFEIDKKVTNLDEVFYKSLDVNDKLDYSKLLKNLLLNEGEISYIYKINVNSKIKTIWSKTTYTNKFLYGINQDISDIVNSKIELKNYEKRYEILYKHLPISIIVTDQNNIIINANNFAIEMYQSELINENFGDYIKTDNLHITKLRNIINVKINKVVFENNIIYIIEDISKILETNNNLIKSNYNYENLNNLFITIADTITDMIWAKDLNGNYIFINKEKCREILNVDNPTNVIGKPDVYFSEQIKLTKRHDFDEICKLSDKLVLLENKQMTFNEGGYANDKWIELEVIKSPLYDKNNVLIGIVGSARNISDKVKNQRQLEDSLKSYKSIFDESTVAIYILDKNLKFINVNKGAEKMYGFSKEYFIDKTPFDLPNNINNNLEYIKNLMLDSYDNGTYNHFEFWSIKNNGSEFIKSVSIYRAFYFGETVIIAISHEITELKYLFNTVKQNEEKFKKIFYDSALGMMLLDLDGNILDVNNSMLNLLEYNKPDLLGTSIRNITHSDDIEYNLLALKTAIKSDNKTFEIDKRYISKTGKLIYAIVNVSLILNKSTQYFIVQVNDITDKKENLKQLNDKNIELQNSNTILENFAYTTSHDMKTPLRGISSYIDKINIRLKTLNVYDEKIKIYFDFVKKSAYQMNDIITDSLNYAKYSTGKLNIVEFNILNVTIDIINDILNGLDYCPIININLNNDTSIKYDIVLYKTMVENLIDNGLKFNDKNEKIISIDLQETDSFYILSFTDNGIGIEDQYYEKIFYLFQRLHGYEIEGNGLGLASVKNIVNRHQGKIEIDSKINMYTTFKIYIKKEI